MKFKPTTFQERSSPDQKQHSVPQREDATLRAQQKGSAELSRVVVGTSAAVHKTQGYGGVQFPCRLSRDPRTRLTQVGVRFGTALLVSPQLSILPAAIAAARIAGFNSTSLVFSGLPRSCVHGIVTSTLESHLDLISPIPSSRCLRSSPRLSSNAHAVSSPSSRQTLSVLSWCRCRLDCSRCPPSSSSGSEPFRLLPDTRVLRYRGVSPGPIHASSSSRGLRLNRFVHATEVGNRFL